MTFFIAYNKIIFYAPIKYLTKVSQTIIKRRTINAEIIHKNFNAMFNQVRKYGHNTTLEGSRGIAQTEGHPSISKGFKGAGKGSLVLIFWCNPNMEIAKKNHPRNSSVSYQLSAQAFDR